MAFTAVAATLVVPQIAHADSAGKGGDYVPFSSARVVLDTRAGTGGVTGARGANSTTSVPALGVSGIPSAGVSGLVLRVLVVTPSAAGYVTVYPDGVTRPNLSTVDFNASQTISNFAVVQPGADGKLAVYNQAGTTQVRIEVQGYFTSAPSGTNGGEVPMTQVRAIDTLNGVGTAKAKIPSGGTLTVSLLAGGVPATASAVSASVTVPTPTSAGSVTMVPTGTSSSAVTLIDYEDGINNTSGATIPLGANGAVTFTNRGPAPVDLIVDTMAYFSKSATDGAGFRPLGARVFGGSVPANSTIDVVVSGTNGMPTRGVAGAALSFGYSGPNAGTLRAWPVGAAEPGIALTQHAADGRHRSSAVVRPGTDGKIRIRNNSTFASQVYVDVEGWYADPLPAIPVVQNSPVSIAQAAATGGQGAGTIEYAYVDNIGRVVIGHQTQLDNFCCVQFSVISGNEAFSGQPALTAQPGGLVQVAAQYTDGDVWTSTQTAPGAGTWKSFTDIGGSMAAPPATAQLSTGVTTEFAIGADGRLWTYAQTGAVPFWRGVGGTNLVGTPVLATVRDGVQVFARTTAGSVATATYHSDGSVSAWSDLGGDGTGVPAVILYPGYRLRVLARAADGSIVTKFQDATGTFPAAWEPLGTFTAAGSPSALVDPVSGRTMVVARGQDGIVYLSVEDGQGTGQFQEWTPAQDAGAPATATDPTLAVVSNGSGQTVIFAYRTVNGTMVIATGRPIGALAASSRRFTSSPETAPAVR
jgi:hypothetical protein